MFYSIRDAKELLGATDRSLTILNALLSFHQDDELGTDGDLIVWPSNEKLTERTNGMPAATLRRHLAVLVECGLIIRRDSPNGKRFARKGRGGQIEQAYGFDLSPSGGCQGGKESVPGRQRTLDFGPPGYRQANRDLHRAECARELGQSTSGLPVYHRQTSADGAAPGPRGHLRRTSCTLHRDTGGAGINCKNAESGRQ